jgi:ankyrin repeat protein
MQQLLDAGADVNAVVVGDDADWLAESRENPIFMMSMQEQGLMQNAAFGGEAALHMAAAAGSTVATSVLLDADADVSLGDHFGATAMHSAARSGLNAVASLLLDRGAAVNAADELGRTPLHYAAESEAPGSTAVASTLLDRGADVNAATDPDEGSMTPLMLAAAHTNAPMVQLLLGKGANVNATHVNGATALHMAELQGSSNAVVQLLRNGGADANVPWSPQCVMQ